MRFNDLMQTILAVEQRTGLAATTLWRQCIDVLAQYDQPGRVMLEQEDRAALVARLHDLRGQMSETQRIASVVELGKKLRSPALIEFFSSDRPGVCAAAMARADLPDALWPVLLPRLGTTARGVLRGRRDIGERTRRALEAFGTTDFVLERSSVAITDDLDSVSDAGVEPASAPAAQTGGGSVDAQTVTAEASGDTPEGLLSADADAGSESARIVGQEERSQIRQLVERIERFTSSARKPGGLPLSALGGTVDDAVEDTGFAPEVLDHFPFETDAEGMVSWVGEASRTALVGLSLAQPATPGETGPDGHVAGAFARRSSFQHGRLFIGEGLYSGEWRLSAVPFFDPATGRFQGYRGQARRPMMHEVPHRAPQAALDEKMLQQAPSPDSMRQIIHELRTPLNAILGFAEIIEQQLFGPAGVHYREMASNILSDARRLLTAFEEIDLAARAASMNGGGREGEGASRVALNIEDLMERVAASYNEQADADDGAARVRISTSAHIPNAYIEPVQGERMVQHLVRTLVSVAGEGEVVRGAVWFQPEGLTGNLTIAFDRPARLAGLDEDELLDPGYGTDGDWPDGPLLGLGFSMRLIRSLARGQGGALRVDSDRILLELPVAQHSAGHELG